jgi:tetratricopeptide (TPR) repeat protein
VIHRRLRDLGHLLVAITLAASAGCATSSGGKKATQPSATAPGPKTATADKGAKPTSPDQPETPRMSARAERLFSEAVSALEDQKKLKVPIDWQALEPKWRAVIEAEEVPEAYYNLGVILEQERRPADAKAAYARALALKPSLRQAALNLAVMSESDGDPRAAASAYLDLLRRFPDDSGARARLATLYRNSGQNDEAWRLAREALMRDPNALAAYKVMMRVALDRRNTDLAELIALRAQKIDQNDSEITFFVGQIRSKQDDENGAVAQYKKALAQRADFIPARYELLRVALKKQLWESVVEEAKAILQVDSSDARVHLALGIAYRYLNQADKALEEYNQAEKLAGGKLSDVYLARGVFYMKLKNVCEPAIADFKQYVSMERGLAANAPVFQLQRECEQIVIGNKQAEEAARKIKAEQEKKKADEEKKKQDVEEKAGGDSKKAEPNKPGAAASPEKKPGASAAFPPVDPKKKKPEAGGASAPKPKQEPASDASPETEQEPADPQ